MAGVLSAGHGWAFQTTGPFVSVAWKASSRRQRRGSGFSAPLNTEAPGAGRTQGGRGQSPAVTEGTCAVMGGGQCHLPAQPGQGLVGLPFLCHLASIWDQEQGQMVLPA